MQDGPTTQVRGKGHLEAQSTAAVPGTETAPSCSAVRELDRGCDKK